MNKINIGLLGLGRIGKVHAANISAHEQANLSAVFDLNQNEAREISHRYDARVMTAEAIMTDPDIDAVVIATPTHTHYAYVQSAIANGKHILCEKPLSLSFEETLACIEQVNQQNTLFMLGFNRRFDRDFSQLKQQYQAGHISNAESITIISRDPQPPSLSYADSCGGLFIDMMIHDIDLACWLLDRRPTDVMAMGHSSVLNNHKHGVDTATLVMAFSDECLITIQNSRRSGYGHDQRVEIHGSEGMLSVANIDEHSVQLSNASGITRSGHLKWSRHRQSIVNECDAFVNMVINQSNSPVPIESGLTTLVIAKAAEESLNTGKKVTCQWTY